MSANVTASELRSRLVEIEKQVECLRVEKESLLECLDSIIYPVLTLPPEITSEIFHHCIRNFARGPLRVASVCKAWRAVALTTPALWSQFWAPTSLQADRNLPNLLQCWLSRARSLPLTLKYIRLGQFSHDAILAILARHSSQWKSLDLNADFQPIVFPVDSILSSLKNLKINVHRWPADSPTCITAFLDAPQLRDVHLAKLSLSQISALTSRPLWSISCPDTAFSWVLDMKCRE
ncbi:hypothetical protein C8R44DRAFT_876481 [Mycena epipterygia]|nr:hypothetical protein C8R44DRAFT_876481 [Mycena epipterygia]